MSIRDRVHFANRPHISRRGLLTGAALGGGLIVAWAVWPRAYPPNLAVADGEHVLNGYLKIGEDGHIVVVVPQAEMGQGAYSLLPQIVADELGADWRTIAVEPAPINPIYANRLIGEARAEGLPQKLLGDSAKWAAAEISKRRGLQWTGGSTSVLAFEGECRRAGAAARTLLSMAAAKRWDADWRACETQGGFVIRGDDRLRFGSLIKEAATFDLPNDIPLRTGSENRLVGRSLPRLDLPSKVDGSVNYAGDIRLPDMLFAAIRMAPIGWTGPAKYDGKTALAMPGVKRIVATEGWVAVLAQTWWHADRALNKLNPQFTRGPDAPSSALVNANLAKALDAEASTVYKTGDPNAAIAGARLVQADYNVQIAPHAALEPMAATAVIRNGLLELWLPTQVPSLAAEAAADAIGFSTTSVVIHPAMIGGSFGRKYEIDAARQAAIMAQEAGQAVQLIWSRAEDMMQDRFRPAAAARLSGRVMPAGQIMTWTSKVAAPDAMAQLNARVIDGLTPMASAGKGGEGVPSAVSGAVPPYAIPNFEIAHVHVPSRFPVGKWRSGADSYTAFFNESFIDELSQASGVEPFSFRMAMLGGNTRLAVCLSRVTAIGGWQGGGEGSRQGLACHSMLGSHIAVLAEARIDDAQQVKVDKLVAVADVGRAINPDIAKQQIEGGLLFGLAAAIGNRSLMDKGVVSPQRLSDLRLPLLGDVKEVVVELVSSSAPTGGVGELAVPPVAPAIANALANITGRRFRSLPLMPGNRS